MKKLSKLAVLQSVENERHHISLSRSDRLPSWEDVKAVRRIYGDPDKFYAIILPPKKFEPHPHPLYYCFDLWEISSEEEMRNWTEKQIDNLS